MIFNLLAFINFAIFRDKHYPNRTCVHDALRINVIVFKKTNKTINLICLLKFEILVYKNKQK